MKMTKYMMSGALMGYALGCRVEKARKVTMRTMKRMKKMLSRRLGL